MEKVCQGPPKGLPCSTGGLIPQNGHIKQQRERENLDSLNSQWLLSGGRSSTINNYPPRGDYGCSNIRRLKEIRDSNEYTAIRVINVHHLLYARTYTYSGKEALCDRISYLHMMYS